MSDNEQKQRVAARDVEVDLNEQIALGDYANLVIISHSPTEFVLDFAAILPGMSKPKVNNRVIVTPEHAKRILRSLHDNITRYEANNGTISKLEPEQHSQDALSFLDVATKIGEA